MGSKKNILRTNASATMWGGSIPEGVNVCLDLLKICSIIKKVVQLLKKENKIKKNLEMTSSHQTNKYPGVVIPTGHQ